MTNKEIEITYRDICRAVVDNRLKEGFDKLTALISILSSMQSTFLDKKSQVESTYRYMLQYVASGVVDPEQAKIHQQIKLDMLSIADDVRENLYLQNPNNYAYQLKKYSQYQKVKYDTEALTLLENYGEFIVNANMKQQENLDLLLRHKELMESFFNLFWLLDRYETTDFELAQSIANSSTITYSDKCLVVSAITLSLMRTFDEKKFLLLLSFSKDLNEEVAIRAMIGFVLAAYIHNFRIQLYQSLQEKSIAFFNAEGMTKRLKSIFLQVVRSKETETITKKMQEDFIPQIAKISPMIQEKLKLGDFKMDDFNLMDQNPEWKNLIEDSSITDKMQEFSELQMEGADVFMSTFSNMKDYRFFRSIHTWFLPYSESCCKEEFHKNPEMLTLFSSIGKSQMLCNSDKYSLAFGLIQMPLQYREMFTSNLNMESQQLEELSKEDNLLAKNNRADIVCKQYMQDLYRFFKLNNYKSDFIDPFKSKLHLYHSYYFDHLGDAEEIVNSLAQTYFKKNFYNEAIELFSQMLKKKPNDVEILQKCAYCYQCKKDFTTALDLYLRSDIIHPDNLWTLQRIGVCYRSLKEPEKALEFYTHAEMLSPDDLLISLNIGYCLLELKRYNDALQNFFKIEYLSSDSRKVWRPIAWCSFVVGKLSQAEKYYNKILESERDGQDWLNMGHVALCEGNRKEALARYRKSFIAMKDNHSDFNVAFSEDIPYLLEKGIDKEILPIILDYVYYNE